MSLKASTAVTGARVASRRPTVAPRATAMSVVADASEERVRLHNLTPLKGSRPRKLRSVAATARVKAARAATGT